MKSKTKIAFFQYDLGTGGIQRSLINLLNSLNPTKYQVDLYLFSTINPFIDEIPEYVNIILITHHSHLMRLLPLTLYRKIIRPQVKQVYDISIDFNGHQNITATYALSVKSRRYLYWIHSDHYKWKASRHRNLLKQLYAQITLSKSKWGKFNELVGVSSGVLEGFRKDFPSKDYWTIPNLINTQEIIKMSKEDIPLSVDNSCFNIACVGRLEYEKGLDIFLPQLAKVLKKRADLHFYIIGDGSCRSQLEKQVQRLKIKPYVTFLGNQPNPYKYLSRMDALILNSRYEGQGMVLREAETLGLQIFFPKHLEKYNDGLKGSDDLVGSLTKATREPHYMNNLSTYNTSILSALEKLLNSFTK